MHIPKSVFSAAALCLVVILSAVTSAKADTTYSYVGNPFTDYVPESCTAPCSLTGSFEVASPLAANLTSAIVVPISFSYTDGTRPVNSSNDGGGAFFKISTDASGMIDEWDIELGEADFTLATILSISGVGDTETYYEETMKGAVPFGFESNRTQGVWMMSTSTGVPEPSSLALFGVGILALAGLTFRKSH